MRACCRAVAAIPDVELRRLREPPLLEIQEQLLPSLLALTDAVDDGHQFLPAFGCGSHEDEQALLLVSLVFQPHVDVDAVGPDVDVLLAREIATDLPPVMAPDFKLGFRPRSDQPCVV